MSMIDLSVLERLVVGIDDLNRTLKNTGGERYVFTIAEAAEFLQVSVPFLETETKAGHLERVKLGSKHNGPVRYTRDALLNYLREHSGSAT